MLQKLLQEKNLVLLRKYRMRIPLYALISKLKIMMYLLEFIKRHQ